MKSIQTIINLLILVGASTLSWSGESIYDKNDLRQFISIGADYRFFDVGDLNATVNGVTSHVIKSADGELSAPTTLTKLPSGNQFYDKIPTGTLEFGVEYQQYLIGLGLNLSPRQSISNPGTSETTIATALEQDTILTDIVQFQDPSFYTYGVDLKLGYKVLSEENILNFIPSLAMGIQSINVEFPALVSGIEEGEQIESKPYSTFAKVINPELEVRIKLSGPIHLGGYAGYRFISFDKFKINDDVYYGNNDLDMDQYYLGAKFTYVFKSNNEKAGVR